LTFEQTEYFTVDPNPDWILIELGQRIRIQRNQNGGMKRKIRDISCLGGQGALLGNPKATSGSWKSNVEVLQQFYNKFSSKVSKKMDIFSKYLR
jgi:hypothetical protein